MKIERKMTVLLKVHSMEIHGHSSKLFNHLYPAHCHLLDSCNLRPWGIDLNVREVAGQWEEGVVAIQVNVNLLTHGAFRRRRSSRQSLCGSLKYVVAISFGESAAIGEACDTYL